MEVMPKGSPTGLEGQPARSGSGQQGRIVNSLKGDWNRIFPFEG
jgi:hypothetical protein